ncbi:MAG: hypothetical protein ABIQ52_13195 [Vicinamibacterales bacterium]
MAAAVTIVRCAPVAHLGRGDPEPPRVAGVANGVVDLVEQQPQRRAIAALGRQSRRELDGYLEAGALGAERVECFLDDLLGVHGRDCFTHTAARLGEFGILNRDRGRAAERLRTGFMLDRGNASKMAACAQPFT